MGVETSPLLRSSSEETSPSNTNKQYSALSAFFITINYLIGTGVFGLPHAFWIGGVWLSIACVVFFGTISIVCGMWVVEVTARAEGVAQWKHRACVMLYGENYGATFRRGGIEGATDDDDGDVFEYEDDAFASPSRTTGLAPPHHEIANRQFDFGLLSKMFVGRWLFVVVQFMIALYSYGTLWAYGVAFATSTNALFLAPLLSNDVKACSYGHDVTTVSQHHASRIAVTRTQSTMSNAEFCPDGYNISLLLFGIVATWMSCQDVSEQLTVQTIMTMYRFICFGLMVLTLVIAFQYPNPFDGSEHIHSGGDVDSVWQSNPSLTWHWSGLGIVFSFFAFAFNVHFNLPDAISPVRRSGRRYLIPAVAGALFVAMVVYIAISMFAAMYFQSKTEALVTLNWSTYTGVGGGWGVSDGAASSSHHQSQHIPMYAVIVRILIMAFPAVNMLSCFPLLAVTLGVSVRDFFAWCFSCGSGGDGSGTTPGQRSRILLISRLFASVPPILLAWWGHDLTLIFNLNGIICVLLQLTVPVALQLGSIYYCWQRWGQGSEKTRYSAWWSHPIWAWLILILSGWLFVVTVISSVDPALLTGGAKVL